MTRKVKLNSGLEYYFSDLTDVSVIDEISISEGASREPYRACCVKVKDVDKAEEIAKMIKDKLDLSFWADKTFDIEYVIKNDIICLVAISTEYADVATAKDMTDVFLNLN